MQPEENNEERSADKDILNSADHTSPDKNADKTGTDTNADKTEIINPEKEKSSNRFDKPKREVNPDRTGIDTNSDKTKK